MAVLSQNEKISLYLGLLFIILIIIVDFYFSSEYSDYELFIIGGTTIIISILLIYTFLLQSKDSRGLKSRRYSDYSRFESQNFRPTVIPPPRSTKKMVIKSTCQFCDKTALMGFTCSYCNNYFCPDHRLPEKHNCIGIKFH